jgi:retinol-binding protein 3
MPDAIHHAEIIDQISTLLEQRYVFPEVAAQMNTHLHEHLPRYSTLSDLEAFASTITEDLQSICHDKHVRFKYDPATAALLLLQKDDEDISQEWLQQLGRENWGFSRVEWLPGQIGYLDMRLFPPPVFAGDIAVAAMNFLANAKTLIFDLRKNGGGDPQMVQFIASYLFPTDIRHLSSIYLRYEDSYTHFWTLPYVPGKRFIDADVFILTSKTTFSGAEDFAYNLKAMERATLIGETTRGGANPGRPHAISDVFTLFVPDGRAINPITKTNWEGTGITPHVEVPAADALKVAHKMAIEKLIERARDDAERQALKKTLEALETQQQQ